MLDEIELDTDKLETELDIELESELDTEDETDAELDIDEDKELELDEIGIELLKLEDTLLLDAGLLPPPPPPPQAARDNANATKTKVLVRFIKTPLLSLLAKDHINQCRLNSICLNNTNQERFSNSTGRHFFTKKSDAIVFLRGLI
jgi:hypothetical protein